MKPPFSIRKKHSFHFWHFNLYFIYLFFLHVSDIWSQIGAKSFINYKNKKHIILIKKQEFFKIYICCLNFFQLQISCSHPTVLISSQIYFSFWSLLSVSDFWCNLVVGSLHQLRVVWNHDWQHKKSSMQPSFGFKTENRKFKARKNFF